MKMKYEIRLLTIFFLVLINLFQQLADCAPVKEESNDTKSDDSGRSGIKGRTGLDRQDSSLLSTTSTNGIKTTSKQELSQDSVLSNPNSFEDINAQGKLTNGQQKEASLINPNIQPSKPTETQTEDEPSKIDLDTDISDDAVLPTNDDDKNYAGQHLLNDAVSHTEIDTADEHDLINNLESDKLKGKVNSPSREADKQDSKALFPPPNGFGDFDDVGASERPQTLSPLQSSTLIMSDIPDQPKHNEHDDTDKPPMQEQEIEELPHLETQTPVEVVPTEETEVDSGKKSLKGSKESLHTEIDVSEDDKSKNSSENYENPLDKGHSEGNGDKSLKDKELLGSKANRTEDDGSIASSKSDKELLHADNAELGITTITTIVPDSIKDAKPNFLSSAVINSVSPSTQTSGSAKSPQLGEFVTEVVANVQPLTPRVPTLSANSDGNSPPTEPISNMPTSPTLSSTSQKDVIHPGISESASSTKSSSTTLSSTMQLSSTYMSTKSNVVHPNKNKEDATRGTTSTLFPTSSSADIDHEMDSDNLHTSKPVEDVIEVTTKPVLLKVTTAEMLENVAVNTVTSSTISTTVTTTTTSATTKPAVPQLGEDEPTHDETDTEKDGNSPISDVTNLKGESGIDENTADVVSTTSDTTSPSDLLSIVKNRGRDVVEKVGPFYLALMFLIIIAVLFVFTCLCCRFCGRKGSRIRQRRLKEYGQEKEFLLRDRGKASKYSNDTVTLLDGSSEDEF